jgi:hypothetical protein
MHRYFEGATMEQALELIAARTFFRRTQSLDTRPRPGDFSSHGSSLGLSEDATVGARCTRVKSSCRPVA